MRLHYFSILLVVSVSNAVAMPSDVYCYGKYAGDPQFFSFKAECSNGKVYEEKTDLLMPSPSVLKGLQSSVVSKMKDEGYQLLDSLREGQILILKRSAHESEDVQKEICVASSVDTGDVAPEAYPYSVILPGAVVDCSKNTDIVLEETGDNDESFVTEVMERSDFEPASQIGTVKIYER
jgi:hypothetical protein